MVPEEGSAALSMNGTPLMTELALGWHMRTPEVAGAAHCAAAFPGSMATVMAKNEATRTETMDDADWYFIWVRPFGGASMMLVECLADLHMSNSQAK